MSAPTNVDLVKGLDMTGVNPATAANLNQLVDSAAPYAETDPEEGKGLVIVTKDSGLTPDVPNAYSGVAKWRRYLWVRIGIFGDTSPKLYAWSPDATLDATYLKWVAIGNTDALSTALTALQAEVTSLTSDQSNFTTQLNAIAAIANQAAADVTTIQGQITDISNLNQAVFTDLPAADASNAAAAAAALAAANAAQATATSANTNSAPTAATNFATSGETILTGVLQGTVITDFAHTLGIPKFYRWVLVCKIAQQGYNAGDEIPIEQILRGAGYIHIFQSVASTNNIRLIAVYNAAGLITPYLCKNTGTGTNIGDEFAITLASWAVKCYAWK